MAVLINNYIAERVAREPLFDVARRAAFVLARAEVALELPSGGGLTFAERLDRVMDAAMHAPGKVTPEAFETFWRLRNAV
jgi:hypothetical protein